MNNAKHTVNYSGNDPEMKKWIDRSDEIAREMSRLRREGKSTIKADDKMEIMEVVCQWDNAFDALDKEGMLDLMTEDCYYTSNAWAPAQGHKGVSDWWDLFTQTFHGKRHTVNNFQIFGNDTEAVCFCYLNITERVNHTDNIGTTIYYDTFVKQNGRWLIKERTQILDPGMNFTKHGQELFANYMASMQQ